MSKVIIILITLVFLVSCSHANNDMKSQADTVVVSELSQEDTEIIKNLRLLEDLETLESMEDENIELLENLDYIESMETAEENNLQEKENG